MPHRSSQSDQQRKRESFRRFLAKHGHYGDYSNEQLDAALAHGKAKPEDEIDPASFVDEIDEQLNEPEPNKSMAAPSAKFSASWACRGGDVSRESKGTSALFGGGVVETKGTDATMALMRTK